MQNQSLPSPGMWFIHWFRPEFLQQWLSRAWKYLDFLIDLVSSINSSNCFSRSSSISQRDESWETNHIVYQILCFFYKTLIILPLSSHYHSPGHIVTWSLDTSNKTSCLNVTLVLLYGLHYVRSFALTLWGMNHFFFLIWLFCFVFLTIIPIPKSRWGHPIKNSLHIQDFLWSIFPTAEACSEPSLQWAEANVYCTWLSERKFCCLLDNQLGCVPLRYWKILHIQWCHKNLIIISSLSGIHLWHTEAQVREIQSGILWNLKHSPVSRKFRVPGGCSANFIFSLC